MTEDTGGPFPHGEVIGGFLDIETPTGLRRVLWDAQLLLHEGRWWAVLLDELDQHTELRASGDTPREAFERLVRYWTIANGGEESPAMRQMLPAMRAELDAAGVV
jgi:hypothetical protein